MPSTILQLPDTTLYGAVVTNGVVVLLIGVPILENEARQRHATKKSVDERFISTGASRTTTTPTC